MCKRDYCLTALLASPCIALVSCEEMDGEVGYSAGYEVRNRAGELSRCATAKEGRKNVLACPAGRTIDSIFFTSCGTPGGICENGFKIGYVPFIISVYYPDALSANGTAWLTHPPISVWMQSGPEPISRHPIELASSDYEVRGNQKEITENLTRLTLPF